MRGRMIVYETQRLTLRHMGPDDFDALMAVFEDPVTMKYYLNVFGHESRDGIQDGTPVPF